MAADKKSAVIRAPIELISRINEYERLLGSRGITMNKTDLMRNFAQNAFTPRDDLFSVLKRIDKK